MRKRNLWNTVSGKLLEKFIPTNRTNNINTHTHTYISYYDDMLIKHSSSTLFTLYRREIATKVLGAKMLQGYTLLEETCDSCAMPLMDYKGEVECAVCPVLERKARKQVKAKKKLEEEKLQLERKVQEKKEIEQKMEEERLENERLEMERIERERLGEGERLESERAELERLENKRQYQKLELERMEEEEKRELERCLGEERTKKEKKAQHDFDALERLQQIRMTMLEGQSFLDSEEERTQALEEEEHKILQQTRERACVLVEQEEMSRLETIANEEDEMRRVLEAQREKEQNLAAKEGEQKAKQEEEALLLLEETKKIEAFDETTVSNKTEVMKQDLLVEEHRKRLAAKALIDDDVVKLMEAREGEALEFRRQAEKRRIESEERIIAALEADAEVKALTAEAAINRAKVALEDVSTAKKGIIIQAITQGEIETVAETEQLMKAQCEDYKEHIILPSASELTRERWETLRAESRAIMTRRILQGWQLTSQGCVGSECHFSPLVAKKDKTECVVCGGTGNGLDGAYATDDEDEKKDAGNDLPSSKPVADGVTPDAGFVETYNEEEFAIQRELVSQEIGKRMMEGWLLIDASCLTCVMPLMMDYLGNSNICVNKNCSGPAIDQQFDASTIATKDMLALKASVSEHEHDTIEGNIVAAIEKEVAEGVLGNNIIAALEKEVTQKALAAEAAITLARAALEGIEITDDDEGIEMTDDATNAINSAKKVVEVIHLEDVSELRSKREVLEDPTVETEEETQIDTPSRPRSPAVDVGEDFSYIRCQTNMIHDSADVGRNDPPAFTSVPPLNSPPAIDAPASFTNDGPSVSFDIDGEDSKEAINAAITAITTVRKEMEAEKIIAVQEPIHTYRFVNEEPDPSEAKETITLPKNVDFADAGVIRSLVDDDDDNESVAADLSTEMIVNMFLRSEHADDLHDSVETLSLKYIKERIDIYVVTNMGSSVSDDFKYKVAARTLEKLQSSELKSIEMIVNMFLKSPHGYDLHQSENKASLGDVKDRVDIFIVTNMDSDVTDEFKFKIAQRIIDKVKYDKVIHLEHLGSPKDPPAYEVSPAATSSYIPQSYYQLAKQSNFSFGEDDVTSKSVTQRRKAPPRPEAMSKRPPMATRSNSFLPPKSPTHSNRFRKGNTIIIGGPSAGPSSPRMRDDDYSAGGASRCSTVASEALESIYEKIEACKDKLLDPSNNLDEQLATASLLEKLATAAVAVKEMELLED